MCTFEKNGILLNNKNNMWMFWKMWILSTCNNNQGHWNSETKDDVLFEGIHIIDCKAHGDNCKHWLSTDILQHYKGHQGSLVLCEENKVMLCKFLIKSAINSENK